MKQKIYLFLTALLMMATTSAWAEDDSREWPFKLSTSFETAYWYQMSVRGGNYCYYDESNNKRISTTTTAPSNNEDKYFFAFVGTKDGFYIYNKAAGKDAPFGPKTGSNLTTIVATTDANKGTFIFEYSTEAGYTNNQLLRYVDDEGNNYLNHMNGNHLAVWHDNSNRHDAGSNFVFATSTISSDAIIDLLHYTIYSDGTAKLNDKNKSDSNVKNITGVLTIPSTVTYEDKTYEVTGFTTDDEFESCKASAIVFEEPTNITSIPAWTFGRCEKVKELKIPEGITTIGGCAFTNMNNLETVVLPSSLTYINEYAFQRDTKLKNIVLSGNNTTLNGNAFNTQGVGSVITSATIIVPDDAVDTYNERFNGFSPQSTISYSDYAKDNLPFILSSDFDNAVWYKLKIVQGSVYLKYIVGTDNKTANAVSACTDDDEYQFAFIGVPFNFKMYNKAAGSELALGPQTPTISSSTGSLSFVDVDNAGILTYEYYPTKDRRLLRYFGYTNYYLNKVGGSLGIWNTETAKTGDGDGSNFIFVCPSSNDEVIDDLHYTLNADGTASLNTNNKNGNNTGELVIASTVKSTNGYRYRVTEIGNSFQNCKYSSIKFETPSNLTTIGNWAFAENNNLTSIELPSSVTNLSGDFALGHLPKLTTITISAENCNIKKYTFGENPNLTEILFTQLQTPPTGTDIFYGSTDETKITVVVPNETAKANFEANDTWKTAKAIITQNEKAILDGTSTDKNGLVYVLSTSTLEGNNIVKKGDTYTCDNLVLTDGYSFAPSAEFTATNATYRRDINKGTEWVTVCLPFAVETAPDGVEFYKVEYINESTITVESTTSLEAGQPALLHRTSSGDKVTITFSGSGKVVKNPVTSTDGLVGSFTNDTKITADGTYYINSNVFKSKNTNFYIDAFRAYLQTNSSGARSSSFSIVVDDDPTGINSAATENTTDEIEGVYSVSGVKQSDLQKGINIVRYRNGKTQKIILK